MVSPRKYCLAAHHIWSSGLLYLVTTHPRMFSQSKPLCLVWANCLSHMNGPPPSRSYCPDMQDLSFSNNSERQKFCKQVLIFHLIFSMVSTNVGFIPPPGCNTQAVYCNVFLFTFISIWNLYISFCTSTNIHSRFSWSHLEALL